MSKYSGEQMLAGLKDYLASAEDMGDLEIRVQIVNDWLSINLFSGVIDDVMSRYVSRTAGRVPR